MGTYLRPTTLVDALDALRGTPYVILAGGTDYYPARVGHSPDEDVLDITAIADLRGIRAEEGSWRIGALTTWTDVIEAPLPGWFDGLKAAAREVGGIQIQNAGTVAGNLCNASPAADGVPPLLALEAEVELSSADGGRTMPLSDFVTGNRTTARGPGEVVTGILVPARAETAVSSFLKLGSRKYLVISIVMVAVTLEPEEGTVSRIAVSVGACSPVAKRLARLEEALTGAPLDGSLADRATASLVDDALSPIDDIRGSGEYRRDSALVLVRRALAEAERKAGDGT